MPDKQEKTEGGNAIRAGLNYTVGNLLTKGLSFLSVILFARLMSTGDYGIFNTFSSYVSMLGVVIGFAMHVSVRNAKLDYPGRLEAYCSSITLITLANTLVFLVLAVVFRKQLSQWLSVPEILVGLIVVESFANAILMVYNEYLAMYYRSKKYVTLSLIYALVGMGLSLIFVCFLFPNARYFGRALGTTLPLLLIAIYILWEFYRQARPRVSREYWRYSLKISLPIVPHGLSQLVLGQFDRIMIKKSLGDEAAGLYSFANNVGWIYQIVTNSLDTAWCPWFFQKMKDEAYGTIRKSGSLYGVAVSVMAVCLLLVSPEVILIMGGAKYAESCTVVMPIILGAYFAFLFTLFSCVEYYYKKTKLIALGTVAAAILNVVLNSLFIPRYGFQAAAYTTAFCYLCYLLIHIGFARKIHGRNLYPMPVIFACILGVTAMTFVCLWLVNAFWIRWGILLAGMLAAFIWGWRNRIQLKTLLSGFSR